MKTKIAVIGDIFCDIVASGLESMPKLDQDTLGKIEILPGGSALNMVSHGDALIDSIMSDLKLNNITDNISDVDNISFILCGAVGSDSQGEMCKSFVNHLKRCENKIVTLPDHSTGSCIVLSVGGEESGRAFVSGRGVLDIMTGADLHVDEILSDPEVCHIHIAGYYNMPMFQKDVINILRIAQEKGMTTSLNPQYDATEKWEGMEYLMPYINVFIGNHVEVGKCGGASESGSGSGRDGFIAAPLLMRSSNSSNSDSSSSSRCHILCTEGSRGHFILGYANTNSSTTATTTSTTTTTLSYTYCQPCVIPSHEIVDTTGAGDALTAAVLIQYAIANPYSNNSLNPTTVLTCRAHVSIAGAAAVCVSGGSTTPPPRLYKDLLAKYRNEYPLVTDRYVNTEYTY
jgi:sugar/nucleoside kinase (ribokinase family)